jgi:hypothetical protein
MQIRRLILQIVVAAAVLAACGAPAAGMAPTVPTAPTAMIVPAAATAPTLQASTITDHPTDATQARLRVALLDFNGPQVDLFVNGTLATNGGVAQAKLGAGAFSGYLFLLPGIYRVALVPTGKGIAEAILGPTDVPVVAGHRYTLAMIGQIADKSVKPLVIDETAAERQIGAAPTDAVRIIVNNLIGPVGIDSLWDGKAITTNVPYGGVAAGLYPVGDAPIQLIVTGKRSGALFNDDGWAEPGTSALSGIAGRWPTGGGGWDTFNALPTSDLPVMDFLKGFSGKHVSIGGSPISFDLFLAALKTAGLSDLLATGGPYLLLPPTDAAFADLTQAQRTHLADPKALADLLRSYVIVGYVPKGSLVQTPGESINRTFTNLQGTTTTLRNDGNGITVNGIDVGDLPSTFVANGTQVHPITTVLLPATK